MLSSVKVSFKFPRIEKEFFDARNCRYIVHTMKLPNIEMSPLRHTWFPLTLDLPKVFGKCKSPYWNRPRRKKAKN
jgi:hypothetical protein